MTVYPLKLSDSALNLKMYVHEFGDQFVSKTIQEKGVWEPYETELIYRALKSDSCFVDVGANIGYYTVVASSCIGPQGKIIAFEPEPKNFELLSQNTQLNNIDNVLCVNAGLSDQNGSAKIFLSENNWGDHQIYDAGLERQSTIIQLYNGDQFLSDKLEKIDVLKVDTQGAEYQVLSGLQQTIQQSLPDIKMVIEFWPFGLRKSGSHAHKLLDLLLSFELSMAIIDQIEHRLIPCVESDIRPWIDELDREPENEGFLNLYLGGVR